MFTDQDMRVANALHAERLEEHENGKRLADYFNACTNWGAGYGKGQRPVIPLAVDSSLSFENQFTLTVFETDRPLTDRQPEEWLPKNFLPTAGAEEIGEEFKHAPGTFRFTGTGAYPPDGERRALNGVTFAFKRGFFGLQGYWVKV